MMAAISASKLSIHIFLTFFKNLIIKAESILFF